MMKVFAYTDINNTISAFEITLIQILKHFILFVLLTNNGQRKKHNKQENNVTAILAKLLLLCDGSAY